MNVREANQKLLSQLGKIYEPRECSAITAMVMEKLTGRNRVDRLMHPEMELTIDDERQLFIYLEKLVRQVPVQYVLGEAWFMSMKFFVDHRVLIPRPETEELVQWIVDDHQSRHALSVLDAGTGSGCIAIALQKKMNEAFVTACDWSRPALQVAEANAGLLQAALHIIRLDILDSLHWYELPMLDIIVSNPPYIARLERDTMDAHVKDHEPPEALFVDDSDPLLFYRALAEMGKKKLKQDGCIYLETHADRAEDTSAVLRDEGYRSVVVRKDMQGRDRMIRGELQ